MRLPVAGLTPAAMMGLSVDGPWRDWGRAIRMAGLGWSASLEVSIARLIPLGVFLLLVAVVDTLEFRWVLGLFLAASGVGCAVECFAWLCAAVEEAYPERLPVTATVLLLTGAAWFAVVLPAVAFLVRMLGQVAEVGGFVTWAWVGLVLAAATYAAYRIPNLEFFAGSGDT